MLRVLFGGRCRLECRIGKLREDRTVNIIKKILYIIPCSPHPSEDHVICSPFKNQVSEPVLSYIED